MMRAHGIDFSKYALDWIMPVEANIDFAIQRTSWGLHKDEKYENHSKRMNQVECRMAYHYYSSAVPWFAQYELFIDLVNNNPHTTYHGVWVDFEEGYNELTRRTAYEFAEFIRYLRKGFDGKVGGYCNRDTYTTKLAYYLSNDWLSDVPLWLAVPIEPIIYISKSDVLEGTREPPWGYWVGGLYRKLSRPKGLWDLWQYSWRGDPAELGIIGKKAVDVNVFNGTVDDLKAWLKIDGTPQPPPPELECKDKEILSDLQMIIKKYNG